MIYFKFVDNGMKEPEEDVYLAMVERIVSFDLAHGSLTYLVFGEILNHGYLLNKENGKQKKIFCQINYQVNCLFYYLFAVYWYNQAAVAG